MRFSLLTLWAFAIASVVAAPQSTSDTQTSKVRDSGLLSLHSLEKRKGGGGGRGGSSGGSSGGSGGRSGSSTGYSGYSFSSSSNVGGRTRDGSGTPKQYGGFYAGGASVPYKAGGSSPTRRIAPFALPIAAVAFFPGIWLFPVWAYSYPMGYGWYANGRNYTSNVTCLCQEYSVCGCDPTDNSTFLANVLTNGSNSGAPVNSTNVATVDWGNGTIASYINGTLDNGTTAAGGSDPSSPDQVSPATKLVLEYSGYWVMIATVVASVLL